MGRRTGSGYERMSGMQMSFSDGVPVISSDKVQSPARSLLAENDNLWRALSLCAVVCRSRRDQQQEVSCASVRHVRLAAYLFTDENCTSCVYCITPCTTYPFHPAHLPLSCSRSLIPGLSGRDASITFGPQHSLSPSSIMSQPSDTYSPPDTAS